MSNAGERMDPMDLEAPVPLGERLLNYGSTPAALYSAMATERGRTVPALDDQTLEKIAAKVTEGVLEGLRAERERRQVLEDYDRLTRQWDARVARRA